MEAHRKVRRYVVEDLPKRRHAQSRPKEDHSEVERCVGEGVDIGDNPLVRVVDALEHLTLRVWASLLTSKAKKSTLVHQVARHEILRHPGAPQEAVRGQRAESSSERSK
jgi:hypothetical protein